MSDLNGDKWTRTIFSRTGLSTGGRGRVNMEAWEDPAAGMFQYRLAFWNSGRKKFVVIDECDEYWGRDEFEAMLEDAKERLRIFLRDNKGDLKQLKGPEHL